MSSRRTRRRSSSAPGDPDAFVAELGSFLKAEILRIAELWLPPEVVGGLDDYLLGASSRGAPGRLTGEVSPWTLWLSFDNPGGICPVYQRICTHWSEMALACEGDRVCAIAARHGLGAPLPPFDLAGALERAGRAPMISVRDQPWEVAVDVDEADLVLVGNDASLAFSALSPREQAAVRATRERRVCVCGFCLCNLGRSEAFAVSDLL